MKASTPYSGRVANKARGEEIANMLLQLEAVKLSPEDPFIWASGWKSPIYCDNRLVLSYPSARRQVQEAFVEAIQEKFPSATCVAGVATAGIAHGILVAEALDLPFCYVRSSAKGHGLQNLIEGRIPENAHIVVIEDLVSTGGSSLKAVQSLRASGADVIGLGAIFTYGFDEAESAFHEADCDWFTLTDYNLLVPEAQSKELIGEKDLESLEIWRQDPENWPRL